KLIRNSVPKNLVSRSHCSFRVRCQSVCITATSGPSPRVSGTNRKWYSEVVANWTRARSTLVEATTLLAADGDAADALVRQTGSGPIDDGLRPVFVRRQEHEVHRTPR